MMQGTVNQNCEATISVVVRSLDIIQNISAVIDTGFSGFLTLP
jgi:predicted aspartyl protease